MRLLTSACLLAVLASPVTAVAQQRYAVIVAGPAGGEKFAAQHERWRTELIAALTTTFAFPDANVVLLDEAGAGTSRATAANVRTLVADLRRRVTKDDTLMLVLLGHGTFDGADAKFNLVGPDLTAGEWKSLLDGIPARVVLVNTTEASFPFLEELSQRGRIVITATDSAAQRFATVFPEYFIRGFADLSSDYDKNGRVSVWEAFTAAAEGVKQYYEQKGQLSTEHPLLDDDGDRVGREALMPGIDGTLAKTVYLDADPRSADANAVIAGLERQRAAVQVEIDALKANKASITQQQYDAALERLLLQLSRIARRIRESS